MNYESFDSFMRRDGVEAMHQANEVERRIAADQRYKELGQKYSGISEWTAEDWYERDINGAKNNHMYQQMKNGKLTWHLWSEDGKQNKREAVCTITTIYQDGHETAEIRPVMVCALPEDSEEVVEGKATVRFTWTEKERKSEVKKVSRSTVCGLANRLSAGMN
jgi:hypothetical protein